MLQKSRPLQGRDIEAVADPSKGYATPNDLLPSAPIGFDPVTTVVLIEKEMTAAGNGAVGVVRIIQPGKIEHVINVVNKNGIIYFVDAQMGKIVTLKPDVPVRLGRPL